MAHNLLYILPNNNLFPLDLSVFLVNLSKVIMIDATIAELPNRSKMTDDLIF